MKPLKIGPGGDLCFSADGDRLVAIQRNVALWSIRSRKKLWWNHPFAWPSDVAFSPDGELVVVKNTAGQLVGLSTEDGSTIFKSPEEGQGSGVLFSPSGDVLVDGSWGGTLTYRSARSGDVLSTTEFPGMVDALHHGPGGQSFISGHQGVGVPAPFYLSWTWEPGSDPVERFDRVGRVSAFDAAAVRVATEDFDVDRRFAVYERKGGAVLFEPDLPVDPHTAAVRWSPDGTLLAISKGDAVYLLDGARGDLVQVWDIPWARGLDFTADSTLLAMGSWKNGLVVDLGSL